MMSAAFTDHLGLAGNFWIFAALNLAGAVFVYFSLGQIRAGGVSAGRAATVRTALAMHLANPGLRAAFMIGFLILFAFIGTFTYVNFVLVRAPLALSRMQVGLVYLVFLPSILSTPLAGHVVARYGAIASLRAALALAASGLPLLLLPQLAAVMAGLALIGVGTFFAQAVATGFVGRAATTLRGAASGMYLASYFSGGLVGSLVLGQLFDRAGWAACVGGIAVAFALALMLASRLALPRSVRAD